MQPPDSVHPLIDETQRQILVAAAGGSVLSLLFLGEPFTWKTAATAILSGLLVAFYGVQLIAGAFALGPGYYGALGAALGFASMALLGGLFKLLRMWRDDPTGFILRFIPFIRRGGDGGP